MENVIAAHKEEYECNPDVVSTAPGRFHLVGEHSWFFKDKTLSMAVNLPVYVAVSKRDDSNLKFNFVQLKERKRANLASLKFKKEDKWANAVKAVVYGFTSGGYNCTGMDFTIYSEILPSAGFGITTAIKIATAWCIRELMGFKCNENQILQVIERANKLFLQTENHKADNFAAIYSKPGSLVLTDFNQNTYDVIPFSFKDRVVMLTDARVPRIVTWNEESLQQPENVLLLGELKNHRNNVYGGWYYEESGAEINEVLSVVNEDTRRRLICVMNEHKCLLDALTAIQKEDFSSFARAINHSHENMRDLYDISCPEIDWILKRVQELDESPDNYRNPVNCGRITGKGFGRCTYTILRPQDVDKYKKKLVDYEKIFGFKSDCYQVEPAEGVHLI